MSETTDPLDLYIAELQAGMLSAERDEFRFPERMCLKSAMLVCGMDRLPDATGADMERCSGEMICEQCGQEYFSHPMDWRVIGYGNVPFLNVLCDGTRVKL